MSLERQLIAVVEDDPVMGGSLVQRLELEGARVDWWKSLGAARAGLKRGRHDAVVCDLRLPDGSGEELFRSLGETGHAPPFLFMTGYADLDHAVRLMRQGASDYVTKPFEMPDFLERLARLVPPRASDEGVLGVATPTRDLERLLRRIADKPASVLITGETGSGKEVCARLLHELGAPARAPFMAVNCAAIPAELMESELFGHERGAFTSAQSRHHGYAERAGAGTLFLDEIGDLAPALQAKLLRLIEDRAFYRLGGETRIPFAARLVCATNVDLAARVAEGRFREDLFYRINVIEVRVPALRERAADIEWLMHRFFADLAATSDLNGFSAAAFEAAARHAWPGNVRELRNRVERAVALAAGPWIGPGDLFPHAPATAAAGGETLSDVREAAERRQIERVLDETGGHLGEAARRLDVSRTTLWEKMRRFRLGDAANG